MARCCFLLAYNFAFCSRARIAVPECSPQQSSINSSGRGERERERDRIAPYADPVRGSWLERLTSATPSRGSKSTSDPTLIVTFTLYTYRLVCGGKIVRLGNTLRPGARWIPPGIAVPPLRYFSSIFLSLSLSLSLFPQIVSFRPLPLRKRSLSLSLIYTPERVVFFFFFFHRVSCSERNLRFPVEIFSVGRNICGR